MWNLYSVAIRIVFNQCFTVFLVLFAIQAYIILLSSSYLSLLVCDFVDVCWLLCISFSSRVKTGYNAVSRLASLLSFCCKDVTNMSETPIEVTVLPVPVESMLYYYGSISRETAEWILWDRGCKDGMYLLRESNSDYVLSLCYQKRYTFSFR